MTPNYKIVQKTSFQIVGLALQTSNLSAAIDIPQFWDRIRDSDVLSTIPNKVSNDIFGLYTDYEGDHSAGYTLIAGCEVGTVGKIPRDMIVKTVPASAYAVFTTKGSFPQSVYETWQIIWHLNLPRTYTGDFEVYGEKFIKNSEVEIYIAIHK
jgi:predicted transcriptional regulator YdeE